MFEMVEMFETRFETRFDRRFERPFERETGSAIGKHGNSNKAQARGSAVSVERFRVFGLRTSAGLTEHQTAAKPAKHTAARACEIGPIPDRNLERRTMQLARVTGRVTATVKHPSLAGVKLLLCQVLGNTGEPTGDPVIAVDKLGAGRGDRVLLTSDGLGLRELLDDANSPARWWTLGIVDEPGG